MAVESGSAKAREWQRRFDRYQASRTTVQTFCAGERVTIAAFYYWRKTLGRVATNDLAAPIGQSGFAPVRLVSSASVTVQLSGGTRLEIPMADTESFERVIRVLMREDAEQAAVQRREADRC